MCVPMFFLKGSFHLSLVSPNEGSPLAEHSDTKALPLPLMDPHLLSSIQTGQHCSPLPWYQARVHVLKKTSTPLWPVYSISLPVSLGNMSSMLCLALPDSQLFDKHGNTEKWGLLNTMPLCLDYRSISYSKTMYKLVVTFGRVITSTLSTSLLKEGGILLIIRCSRNSWAPWNMSPPPTTRMELYIFRLVSSDAVKQTNKTEKHLLSSFFFLSCMDSVFYFYYYIYYFP